MPSTGGRDAIGECDGTLLAMSTPPYFLPNRENLPRVLTREHALALGLTRRAIDRRLASNEWHRVLPRVYLTGSTLTWWDRLDAALAFAGPDALLTGAAALAGFGLRTVPRPNDILLLVPRTNRVRPTGWVRIRRTDRMPARALMPGPRRADLARAVADLALERRRLDDVRALVTQALRSRLCTSAELWAELEAGPRKFSANLRTALLDADRGAWSAPEARAAHILRGADVPAFEANAPLRLADGEVLWVDFLWRALRAVLEIDSFEFHDDEPAQRDHTDERHIKLARAGFSVVHRRPGVIIREPNRFRREMEQWLAARALELRTGA